MLKSFYKYLVDELITDYFTTHKPGSFGLKYFYVLFENAEHTKTMALKGKKHAELTHDPKKNLEDLLLIYKEIKGED